MEPATTKIQYRALRLPETEPFQRYKFEEDWVLKDLSVVNIFVGSNNSGKSRLLRHLFKLLKFEYATNQYGTAALISFIEKYFELFKAIYPQNVSLGGGPTPSDLQTLRSSVGEFISTDNQVYDNLKIKLEGMARHRLGQVTIRGAQTTRDYNGVSEQIRSLGEQALREFQSLPSNKALGSETRYYVPMLRGMRPLNTTVIDSYSERTLGDYFRDISTDGKLLDAFKVFTGLELYQRLKVLLLGDPEGRELVARFQEFLSKHFFEGREITLIPREGDNLVHVKIGREKQLPIYSLGDGIQNLIIVTFNMFANNDRCLFFIEEPDLSMHPGLQRAFLEILMQFDQHQYFLTTHSNHLLDMSADFRNVSIYLFQKENDRDEVNYEVRLATSPDANILRELGVRNSSVFLTNATIWVEGITDRMYMREFLNKFQEEKAVAQSGGKTAAFQEDIHFSFVEYQGSNLVHWTFDDDAAVEKIKANRLCARSFLVADGDVSEKGTRADDYKKMLGERFYILPCKEIENVLPEEIVRELAKKRFLEKGSDVSSIRYAEYSKMEMGLGKYLDEVLGTDEPVFSAPSGTLKNKVTFCEEAIKVMNTAGFNWSLTPSLRELCEKIYAFVSSEND